mmetsp:Transcript_27095/g.41575  ORF Transcript_27095/g.41575 Transcript_27095/m.41575 type:complete len:99 (+) Transcript_27095:298-594(+)
MRELRLDVNTLSGSLTSRLGSLEALEIMRLEYNRLVGTVPEEFGKLKQIEELNIEGNQLLGSVPSELCKLRAQRVFDFQAVCYGGNTALECACCDECK